MKALQKNMLTQMVVWLLTEIVLNLVGLDNLADYSEFISHRYLVTEVYTQPAIALLFDKKFEVLPLLQV
jgi:hypothetical protein